MPQQVRQGLLLTVIAAVVFLIGLGSTHLWDDDETFFAEVAREMYARDDLIVPWFNDQLFAHKPPFMYWMMIGAYHALGVNEFAARLPSVLFGLATVLLVWRLGRILYSPRAGFWAAVALATNLNFTVISRAATSDAELAFFCTLSLYLFVRGTAVRRLGSEGEPELVWHARQTILQPTLGTYAQVYAAMGVAVLVKGPIGVMLPTAVLGLFLLWMRRLEGPPQPDAGWKSRATSALRLLDPRVIFSTIWNLRPLSAVVALLAISGPWYLVVSLRTDGAFLAGFFGTHHFNRFLNPMDNHSGPMWYYLAAVCVGFFPWIIFLMPTLIDWYRRVRERHPWYPGDVLCAAWCLVWFVFFSLASTKFPHYVVPAYPALALMTAAFLDRWIASADLYGTLARRGAWVTIGVVGLGIMIVVPIVEHFVLNDIGLAGVAGLPLLVGAVFARLFTERRQIARGLVALTGSAIAFLVILFAYSAVEIDQHQNSDVIAAKIRGDAGEARPRIAHFHYYRPGLTFYCREPIAKMIRPEDAIDFLNGPSPSYLLTSRHEFERLQPDLPAETKVLGTLPWFLKRGKEVVVLGRNVQSGPVASNAAPTRDNATN